MYLPTESIQVFKEVAIEGDYLSADEADELIEGQITEEYKRSIWDILSDKGSLKFGQFKKIIDVLRTRNRNSGGWVFGQVAIEMGLITQEDVEKAIQLQKESDFSKRLGKILTEMGVMTESQVRTIVSEQVVSVVVCERCLASYRVKDPLSEPDCCSICDGTLGPTPS